MDALVHPVAREHPDRRSLGRLARTLRLVKDRSIRGRVAFASKFDLIYANCSVSASVFDYLPPDHAPIISHIHELEYGLCHGISEPVRDQLVRHTDRYIAAADCVAQALTHHFVIPPDQVAVHHAFVDVKRMVADRMNHGPAARQELGIPADAFVVGSSGIRDWRKATDLFLLLAARLTRLPTPRPFYFVWVGGKSEGLERGALAHDLRCLDIEDRVRFVDATPVPARYFSTFDVFMLTSREDPFPLVSLEAALLELPILSFDSGGARELIENGDIGRVVPYSDLDAMADALLELAADDRLRASLGQAARAKVEEHFDVSVVAPRIVASLGVPVPREVQPPDEPVTVARPHRGSLPMHPPVVSVCVPTYNGGLYLRETLRSIAAQTVDDYEVIVVDDASTDATVSIAEEFAGNGLPLWIHRSPSNQGLARNWNRCLDLARGQWIKFVFQDDLLDPRCLERMLAAADESNGFVACERSVMYERDITAERRNGYEELTGKDLLRQAIGGRSELTALEFSSAALVDIDANFVGEPVAVMFDRKVVRELGGFNPDLVQSVDFEYCLRIGSNVGLSYVPEPLSTFRVHGTSTTVANERTRLFRMTFLDKLLVRAITLSDPRHVGVRAAAARAGIDLEGLLREQARMAEQFIAALDDRQAAQAQRDWKWALANYPVLRSRRP
jgi:glycosyltransferase involved in cell wall biosynthesis